VSLAVVHSLGFRPGRLGRGSLPFVAIGIAFLVVSGISPAASFLHSVAAAGTPSTVASVPAAPSAPPAVHPATFVTYAGTYYGTNSTFANLPSSDNPCSAPDYQNYSYWFENVTYNYTYSDCFGGAQNPSLLTLGNGNLGVAYETYTTNQTNCTSLQSKVVSRVGFQVSTDSGAIFGPAQYLGNQSCAYLQAIEPSFAVSSAGTVVGTFVEENETNTTNSLGISLPTSYANRTDDALGFTNSTNNGASFHPVSTIAVAGSANIARPQIATFGKTVYIVYDQLNNWTNLSVNQSPNYPYPEAHPIAVDLIYSSDEGQTWQGPYTLPGLNASQGYNSFSPAISVSSAGTLAVAYATGHACFYGFGTFCDYWGDDAVVATSTTNGTTWSAPAVLGFVGETHRMGYDNATNPTYWDWGYAYQFQVGPELAVAWSDTSSSTVYAAWAGQYSYKGFFGFRSFGDSGVFAAVSTNSGGTWVSDNVSVPTYSPFQVDEYDFDPALVVHAGTVYLAYSIENESYCDAVTCSPFAEHYSYWMVNSTNGTFWGTPTYLSGDTSYYYEDTLAWPGYNDAITYTSDGPVASFSEPQNEVESFGFSTFLYANNSTAYEYWYNDTGLSDLAVSLLWTGPTVDVNLSENGLPAGAAWEVAFTGHTFNVTVTTIVVTGVPVGQVMSFVQADPSFAGYWTEYSVLFGNRGIETFNAPGNLTFDFMLLYGLALQLNPSTYPQYQFSDFIGDTYFYWDTCGPGCFGISEPFPWYIPAGTTVPFGPGTQYFDPLAPIAYTGNGNGSSNVVAATTSITMNGPINETIWFGALGNYPVTFVPTGLPASSTYSFTFDGSTYSAGGTQDVAIQNVSTGAYSLGNITATSVLAGWEYFGVASSGPTVVVPNVLQVDLNFSAVDVAAPAGPVTFEANGLAAGDFWTVSFNGTSYSSTTPTIDVTAHPGNYSVSSAAVPASANDSWSYVPVGFGPSLTVAPSTTYPVDFSPQYRVEVISGAGGSVTGAGSHWYTPGTLASFTASAHADYVFLGWTGTGLGSYSGTDLTAPITANAPITESANFEALPVNRFNLTINATGLPAGTWWSASVGGIGYSTDRSSLVVPNLFPCSAGAPGLYNLSIPEAYLNGTAGPGGTRYLAGGAPSTICTTGATVVTAAFTSENLVTPIASGAGSAYAVVDAVPSTSAVWVPSGTTVDLQARQNSNAVFDGWVGTGAGAYSGTALTQEFTPTGPVTETATFSLIVSPPPPTYRLSLHSLSTFVAGTSWSATVGTAGYSTTGSWINLTGLATGSYSVTVFTSLAPDGQTEYTPTVVHSPVTLTGNDTVPVTFATSYWVNESASPGGSLTGASSGFEPSGRTLTIAATPSTGYVFVQWVGTGTGAYSGTNASSTIVVHSPITELASFAPLPATGSSSSTLGSNSIVLIAALAAVGLVVGVGVGYVLSRRRGAGPGGSE
jgi:hypothetical protein